MLMTDLPERWVALACPEAHSWVPNVLPDIREVNRTHTLEDAATVVTYGTVYLVLAGRYGLRPFERGGVSL